MRVCAGKEELKEEKKVILDSNIENVYRLINSLTGAKLFLSHQQEWADEATKNSRLGGGKAYSHQ